jgi:hypothetical protein
MFRSPPKAAAPIAQYRTMLQVFETLGPFENGFRDMLLTYCLGHAPPPLPWRPRSETGERDAQPLREGLDTLTPYALTPPKPESKPEGASCKGGS